MKAEELVTLAAAHGIDISHTVACETNLRGAAARRRRTDEERRIGAPVRDTVTGAQTRVHRPRTWTHAETGLGAAGCPRMPWLAACYSWAGDRTGYKELHRGLTLQAIKEAQRHDWPWRITLLDGTKDYYLERLTELVLDEEGCKPAFTSAPGLYAIYLGVSPVTWSKPLWGYYLTLQQCYQRWLDIVRGTIGRKLAQD